MILLLGGTSETAAIADGLAESGHDVLVSNCTDTPLDVGSHKRIRLRFGALDAQGMRDLIAGEGVSRLVDATHPYAVNVSEIARTVCREMNLPYYRLERPRLELDYRGLHVVSDHIEAAARACSLGKVILLTTGSRNLKPYVDECKKTQRALFARVLPREDSLRQCRDAGIREDHIIAARGPFSVEQNEAAIRRRGVDALVTKESGKEGGVPEKLEAARRCACQVVLVERPAAKSGPAGYGTVHALLSAVEADAHCR